MSSCRHGAYAADHEPRHDGPAGIAPGKRSLTQSMPPVQRSLQEQQRQVTSFDAGVEDHFYDERATVEARPSRDLLSDRQVRLATRKNPMWVRRLKVSAQIFSTAPVESSAFAMDVAEKQATAGLDVDGIAGPKTVAAIAGEVAAARSTPGRRGARAAGGDEHREVVDFDAGVGDEFYDERATVEPAREPSRFADDDPFGMHLIGTT